MLFLTKLKTKLKTCISNFIKPMNKSICDDYYNGSDNEIKNIFLEIQNNILNQPINIFNLNDYKDRLCFLVDEGLDIIEFFGKPKKFKVTPKEADDLIVNLIKKNKLKNVKKVVKRNKPKK